MPSQEYKITTIQPQKANVDSHSFYSSSTIQSRGGKCETWSDDDKRCCSCMCSTCFAIGLSIILINFAC